MKVDGPEISKYGVVVKSKSGENIVGLVEKPKYTEAPTNLASVGRYVLTPDIFEILRKLPKGLGNEVQLADAINSQARKGAVDTVILNGTRFDCGSVEGFIAAINHEYSKRLNK